MQCDPSNWNIIYRAYKFDWNPCSRPSARKIKATMLNDSSVLFSWNQSSGAAKYLLQYRSDGSGYWNNINANANQFSITANHLIPNSSYEWRMQTWCDSTGEVIRASRTNHFLIPGKKEILPTGIISAYILIPQKTKFLFRGNNPFRVCSPLK